MAIDRLRVHSQSATDLIPKLRIMVLIGLQVVQSSTAQLLSSVLSATATYFPADQFAAQSPTAGDLEAWHDKSEAAAAAAPPKWHRPNPQEVTFVCLFAAQPRAPRLELSRIPCAYGGLPHRAVQQLLLILSIPFILSLALRQAEFAAGLLQEFMARPAVRLAELCGSPDTLAAWLERRSEVRRVFAKYWETSACTSHVSCEQCSSERLSLPAQGPFVNAGRRSLRCTLLKSERSGPNGDTLLVQSAACPAARAAG